MIGITTMPLLIRYVGSFHSALLRTGFHITHYIWQTGLSLDMLKQLGKAIQTEFF